jgi:hypothetical protein
MLENKTRHGRKLTPEVEASSSIPLYLLLQNSTHLLLQNSRQVMNPFLRPCTPKPTNNRRGFHRMCRSHPHQQTQPFYHRFDVWKNKSRT